MFKINKERVLIKEAVYEPRKLISDAVYEDSGEVYHLDGEDMVITAKYATFGDRRITKAVLEAVLSGEYADVRGITVQYDTTRVTNQPLNFNGFTVPKGAEYEAANYYHGRRFKFGGTTIEIEGVHKPDGGWKSISDVIKTPVGYLIAQYKVKRNKKSISLGCQNYKFNDIIDILRVMESKEK